MQRCPRGSAKAGGGSKCSLEHPESAFTVVRANETIQDVALRVYGSSDRPTRSGGPIVIRYRAGILTTLGGNRAQDAQLR